MHDSKFTGKSLADGVGFEPLRAKARIF